MIVSDQVLYKGTTFGCCEHVTWAVPVNDSEPQTAGT